MSERALQWSLTGLTLLVIVWLAAGLLFRILPGLLVVLSGLAVEIVVGGILISRWGKDYMGRRF